MRRGPIFNEKQANIVQKSTFLIKTTFSAHFFDFLLIQVIQLIHRITPLRLGFVKKYKIIFNKIIFKIWICIMRCQLFYFDSKIVL